MRNKFFDKYGFYIFVIAVILTTNLVTYTYLTPKPSEFYGEIYYKQYSDMAHFYFTNWGWDEQTSDDPLTALTHDYYFYECGHGGSYSFKYGDRWVSVWDIPNDTKTLPANFIMLVSCDALTHKDGHSWSNVLNYRVMVGLKNTTYESWSHFKYWQSTFFKNLDRGDNFTTAFNKALKKYPVLKGHIELLGDGSLTVHDMTIPRYDLNRDRRVNILDLIEVSRHWTG